MKRKIEHSRPSGKGDTKLSIVRPCLSWPLECSFFISVHFLLLWLLCLLLFALFPAWLFPVRAFRGRRLPLLLLLFCRRCPLFAVRSALVVLRALIASCVRLFRLRWCSAFSLLCRVWRLRFARRGWFAGWPLVRVCSWCSLRRPVRRALCLRLRSVALVPARGVQLRWRSGWAFRCCFLSLRCWVLLSLLLLRWLSVFVCLVLCPAVRGGFQGSGVRG